VAKWMKEHDMNASGLGRHFWQQVTAQVLPDLNRTLGVWEDDQPQPHPDDLPSGSFGNIWQAQSTIESAVNRKFDAVLSGPWCVRSVDSFIGRIQLIVLSGVSPAGTSTSRNLVAARSTRSRACG
jgi:hypothetical protein